MRKYESLSGAPVWISIGLAALAFGAMGVGCSSTDAAGESGGPDYTAQGACDPGDDEVASTEDREERTRSVRCRRTRRDAGADAAPIPTTTTTTTSTTPPPPPPPPSSTCTSFTYSAWGACQPDSTQTRTLASSSPAGCTGGTPVLSQACTYVAPMITCTSFTYSAWGACQSNNTQTRTVASSSPSGCSGGSPVVSQACTYTAPIDGAALYTQYCSNCHGNGKKGKAASTIQSAINNNTGGMGSLSFLTPAQIAAISAAP